MRVHAFLFGTTVVLVGAAAGIQACGGDTTTATPVDAGNDHTVDVVPMDAPAPMDAGQDTNLCDPDADFLSKIPDASLDDGASSTGICAGCVESKCSKEVAACKANCNCQGAADKGLVCFAMNGLDIQKLIACLSKAGVNAAALASGPGQSLLTCAGASCPTECPIPDGGPMDSGGD